MQKLRVGLVGLQFGKQILQNMLLKGPGAPFLEVAGICDLDQEAARAVADSCSLRAFPTYEEMLADATIYRNPVILPQVPMNSSGKTLVALVTKDRLDGTPLETVELGERDLSNDYQWEVFHRAFSTRVRPEHETPDEVVVNAIRIIEKMREAARQSPC